MTSALTIFLLIGVAHLASHIIECDECRGALNIVVRFALEGIIKVFGWPIAAGTYFMGFFRKHPAELKAEQIEKIRIAVTEQVTALLSENGKSANIEVDLK